MIRFLRSHFGYASMATAILRLAIGKVASLRMQGSRTTGKIRLAATQCPRASVGFNERHHIYFSHRLAAVLTVCPRQRWGELEANDRSPDDDCRSHGISVRKRG